MCTFKSVCNDKSILIQFEEYFLSIAAAFHLNGLQGLRIDNNFLWFFAKAVEIIQCDRQLSLLDQMLSFQRNVELFVLITPLNIWTQIVIQSLYAF